MMTLVYSTTSPFARKVLVMATELGLREQIRLEIAHPLRNAGVVSAANPLGKVPCLLPETGPMVVNSPAICRYLQRQAQSRVDLLSSAALSITDVERIEALADGVMDAAVALVMESLRPQEQQSPLWQERWNSAIARTLQHITSHELSALSRTTETLAEIALACALGYLNFRLPQLAWAEAHPALKEWFETVSRVPSLSDTAPAD